MLLQVAKEERSTLKRTQAIQILHLQQEHLQQQHLHLHQKHLEELTAVPRCGSRLRQGTSHHLLCGSRRRRRTPHQDHWLLLLDDVGQRNFGPLRRRRFGALDQEQDDKSAHNQSCT